jgi:hypothetical protein
MPRLDHVFITMLENHYPDPKIAGNHYPHTSIVMEMEARHIPWDAYMQAMPSSG